MAKIFLKYSDEEGFHFESYMWTNEELKIVKEACKTNHEYDFYASTLPESVDEYMKKHDTDKYRLFHSACTHYPIPKGFEAYVNYDDPKFSEYFRMAKEGYSIDDIYEFIKNNPDKNPFNPNNYSYEKIESNGIEYGPISMRKNKRHRHEKRLTRLKKKK